MNYTPEQYLALANKIEESGILIYLADETCWRCIPGDERAIIVATLRKAADTNGERE